MAGAASRRSSARRRSRQDEAIDEERWVGRWCRDLVRGDGGAWGTRGRGAADRGGGPAATTAANDARRCARVARSRIWIVVGELGLGLSEPLRVCRNKTKSDQKHSVSSKAPTRCAHLLAMPLHLLAMPLKKVHRGNTTEKFTNFARLTSRRDGVEAKRNSSPSAVSSRQRPYTDDC